MWCHESGSRYDPVFWWWLIHEKRWRHQIETFSAYLALCEDNPVVTAVLPHKGHWRETLIFPRICAWANGWINNRDAGELKRHRAHYDVTVLVQQIMALTKVEPLTTGLGHLPEIDSTGNWLLEYSDQKAVLIQDETLLIQNIHWSYNYCCAAHFKNISDYKFPVEHTPNVELQTHGVSYPNQQYLLLLDRNDHSGYLSTGPMYIAYLIITIYFSFRLAIAFV